MNYWKFFGLAIAIIIIDQIVKLLVHAYLPYGMQGETRLIGDWFKLHYTLNPGMAFGLQLGSQYGKLVLSLFRLVAMGGIAYYLYYLIKQQEHPGYLYSVALILGGAVGNVVDSTFYGVFLNNAPAGSPTPWFHGQVVDMIYIDIWEGFLPEWIPLFGGQFYAFWPIFNIADASIFVGISLIILFQKRFFKPKETTTHA